MIYWLTENSMIPMVTGIILSLIFFIVGFVSRERVLQYIAMGIALLTILTVTCEQLIVTDKEEVESILNTVANHAARNDLNSILPFISDKHPETKQNATSDMSKGTFTSCTVIGTNSFEGPTAGDPTAEICVAVSASGTINSVGDGTLRLKFIVNLDKEGDQWKVTKYKYESPLAGLKQ